MMHPIESKISETLRSWEPDRVIDLSLMSEQSLRSTFFSVVSEVADSAKSDPDGPVSVNADMRSEYDRSVSSGILPIFPSGMAGSDQCHYCFDILHAIESQWETINPHESLLRQFFHNKQESK